MNKDKTQYDVKDEENLGKLNDVIRGILYSGTFYLIKIDTYEIKSESDNLAYFSWFSNESHLYVIKYGERNNMRIFTVNTSVYFVVPFYIEGNNDEDSKILLLLSSESGYKVIDYESGNSINLKSNGLYNHFFLCCLCHEVSKKLICGFRNCSICDLYVKYKNGTFSLNFVGESDVCIHNLPIQSLYFIDSREECYISLSANNKRVVFRKRIIYIFSSSKYYISYIGEGTLNISCEDNKNKSIKSGNKNNQTQCSSFEVVGLNKRKHNIVDCLITYNEHNSEVRLFKIDCKQADLFVQNSVIPLKHNSSRFSINYVESFSFDDYHITILSTLSSVYSFVRCGDSDPEKKRIYECSYTSNPLLSLCFSDDFSKTKYLTLTHAYKDKISIVKVGLEELKISKKTIQQYILDGAITPEQLHKKYLNYVADENSAELSEYPTLPSDNPSIVLFSKKINIHNITNQ